MNKLSITLLLVLPFVLTGCIKKTAQPIPDPSLLTQTPQSLESFEDIYPDQVTEEYTINGDVYALVQQPSSLTSVTLPADVDVQFVGLLKKVGDNAWIKIAKIEDLVEDETDDPRNNPLAVWEQKGALRLAVVDQTGDKNGEGVFKIFAHKDNRIWVQESCGYFDPEKGSFLEYEQRITFEYFQFNSIDKSYQSGPTFIKELGEERMINEPACDNVFVSVFTGE